MDGFMCEAGAAVGLGARHGSLAFGGIIVIRIVIMGLLDDLFDVLFPARQYGKQSVTKLGVEVRSGAEQRIADYFESVGLAYKYEQEIRTGIWIFTEKVSCPDFYLPAYDVYVEYWGMLSVEDNRARARYERAMRYKMARYHDLGIKFISIYPDNMKNLDWIFRKKFKQVTGIDLPRPKHLGKG